MLVTAVKPFPYGPSSRARAHKSHVFSSVRSPCEIQNHTDMSDHGFECKHRAYIVLLHYLHIHLYRVLYESLLNIAVSSNIFFNMCRTLTNPFVHVFSTTTINTRLNSVSSAARRVRHACVLIYDTRQLCQFATAM